MKRRNGFGTRNVVYPIDISLFGIYCLDIQLEISMVRTKIFQSNRSQAVRLAKEVAFPEGIEEVTIIKEGARRVIVPTGAVWDDFFSATGVSFPDRDQPQMQQRETF